MAIGPIPVDLEAFVTILGGLRGGIAVLPYAGTSETLDDGDPRNDGYFFVNDRLFVVTDFLHALMALQGGAGADEEVEDEVELMEIISYRVE